MVLHPAVHFHDDLAAAWEGKYGRPTFRRRAIALFGLLGDQSLRAQRWLDAGCGSGFLSWMLAEAGCDVLGIDASPRMIQAATSITRQDFSEKAGSLEFRQIESIEHLPMADGAFHGILCSSVLEYLDEPKQCLEEFHRVLRPRGVLLLSVPNRHSVIRRAEKLSLRLSKEFLKRPWPEYLLWSRNEYSLQAIVAVLAGCGFELRKREYYAPGVPRLLSRTIAVGSLILALAVRGPLRA